MPKRINEVVPPAKLGTLTQASRSPHALVAIYGLSVSVLLFVACLALPAYTVEGPEKPDVVHSLWELVIGWLGVFYGIQEWLANPLLVIAWGLMLTRRYKAATIVALAAALISASFLLRDTVVISEAPTYGRVVAYHGGYWLWLGSAAAACAASAMAMRRSSHGAGA